MPSIVITCRSDSFYGRNVSSSFLGSGMSITSTQNGMEQRSWMGGFGFYFCVRFRPSIVEDAGLGQLCRRPEFS